MKGGVYRMLTVSYCHDTHDGGTEMPFRSDGSSYAEATSEARSGVEKRAGFRFLVHRSFLILMGRRESAHPSGYGFLNYRSMGV